MLDVFVILVLGRGRDREMSVVHWLKMQWVAPEEQQPKLPHTHATPTPTYILWPHVNTPHHIHTQRKWMMT